MEVQSVISLCFFELVYVVLFANASISAGICSPCSEFAIVILCKRTRWTSLTIALASRVFCRISHDTAFYTALNVKDIKLLKNMSQDLHPVFLTAKMCSFVCMTPTLFCHNDSLTGFANYLAL